MRLRPWIVIALLAVGGAGFLAAHGTSAPLQKGGSLRIASARDFDSIDPALAYRARSWMIEFATCARLFSYPDKPAPAGSEVIPEVAVGFPKVSRDGKTQTIQLRPGYRFHTGQAVTAANFVAAINRVANPELESPASVYLHEIVGADDVIAGKAETITGVTALGRQTLQIRTTVPMADLPARLTMPFFCPIAVRTPPQELEEPLGSGPYYVASRVPNRQLVLQRNRFYRGPRRGSVDRVVWSVGLGLDACRVAVERNEIDYCEFLSLPAYAEVAAKYGINEPNGRFFFNRLLETEYFAFNHDRPAFKGPGQIPLKQAINWAIDRPALARAAGYLGGARTDQILPPAMGRRASIYPLGGVSERSLAKARALLAKARFRPKKLVLYTGTGPYNVATAQIFQFNLKRLGIDVEVKYFDDYLDRIATRGEAFDVAYGGWAIDYADPITFFSQLDGESIGPDRNANVAYFDRPKYNRAIARINRLTGQRRADAWADLDVEMMRNDPPWAPFMNFAQRDFVSRSFGCFAFQTPVGRPNIVAACKK